MWEQYWTGRGSPWEFDAGPKPAGPWAKLFAETPNYRGLGVAWSGNEEFRWHFGPMFYRGRLDEGDAKVLIIGQEGAQDESLSHRSFTGGTGGRMQNVLNHLGVTRSYQFANTFVYPIFGQYDAGLRPLAQDPRSPIAKHRQALLDLAATHHDLRLVIAVGLAAKESVASWVKAHGGTANPDKLHEANGSVIKPGLRLIGVLHPGGATAGGAGPIIADFKAKLARIEGWIAADAGWLRADADGVRLPASDYKYRNAPIPFRDFPFGVAWRLGYGTTTSNRRDGQTAIQLFSDDGKYNNEGATVSYPTLAAGTNDGYDEDTGDLPYEPPKHAFGDFDRGPTAAFAKLLQGGKTGFPWPDFGALGLPGHPSFGFGPIFRGRLSSPSILVLADQASQDDLFLARALTGEAGQRLQGFLQAAGIDHRYAVLRTLPVDSMSATAATVKNAVDDPKVRALLREVVKEAGPQVVLAIGAQATRIVGDIVPGAVPKVTMQAWGSGALADWRRALHDLSTHTYTKDRAATATWDGGRLQIPRIDLPYGTLRWEGSSGDRAAQAKRSGKPSPDYFKIEMPDWAAQLKPTLLTAAEQHAIDQLKS
ncbi:MAG TPA: uracil-DNA glycosylase family protein [Acidimicrobiia bacterium]|nr:uracil-DNA glycosylase family protein [Acidimicrobiia bacterium]